MDSIFEEFGGLKKNEFSDITDKKNFRVLDDFLGENFIHFDNVKRPDLYRLSMMIEDHAQRAYEPLLATFETEHLYKYVEKRYLKIIDNIPNAWIIGGFLNPFFAPKTPPDKAEILTCAGTSIENMWIVVTKSSEGLFGLVAEDLGGVEKGDWFRGFFTTRTDILQKVVDKINQIMGVNIDFSKKIYSV